MQPKLYGGTKSSSLLEKGISPGTYYGDPSVGISFFAPETGGGLFRGLYILGGIEGSVCTDTDHFDNSVILHEYGHYLENAFGKSDSPGGSHNGNKIIDPRLAWSEGWSDFFQAAVLGRNFYRDTTSNIECPAVQDTTLPYAYRTAKISFPDFLMKNPTVGQDYIDNSSKIGEGNFREISIARALYGTLSGPRQPANSDSGSAYADMGFAAIWKAFTQMSSASYFQRNMALLNQFLSSYITVDSQIVGTNPAGFFDVTYASTTAILSRERHRRDLKDFGHTLTPTVASPMTCSASPAGWFPMSFKSADAVKDTTNSSGFITWSDQFNSNDFWRYDFDGSAARAKIYLKYRKDPGYAGPIANPWDLDLYVYGSKYTFLNNPDILRKSENVYPEIAPAALGQTGQELVDLTGLPAGTYMINVKIEYNDVSQPSAKADTQYWFELNSGEQICP